MTKRKAHPEEHPETRMVNVRVPVEQLERLRLVAEADHRTVSQEVRRLIDLRIAECERGAA